MVRPTASLHYRVVSLPGIPRSFFSGIAGHLVPERNGHVHQNLHNPKSGSQFSPESAFSALIGSFSAALRSGLFFHKAKLYICRPLIARRLIFEFPGHEKSLL
jgi:hypothetical protein